MDIADINICPLCDSKNTVFFRDEHGCTTKCPDCHAIHDADDDDIVMLEMPEGSLATLTEWFPLSQGILDADDVLDACAGHKVADDDPILLRVTKFKELGVEEFLVVDAEFMHPDIFE